MERGAGKHVRSVSRRVWTAPVRLPEFVCVAFLQYRVTFLLPKVRMFVGQRPPQAESASGSSWPTSSSTACSHTSGHPSDPNHTSSRSHATSSPSSSGPSSRSGCSSATPQARTAAACRRRRSGASRTSVRRRRRRRRRRSTASDAAATQAGPQRGGGGGAAAGAGAQGTAETDQTGADAPSDAHVRSPPRARRHAE